jgi:hypothetical protein
VNDGDDAMPLDNADFDESATPAGADEHRHRIVLHEVADRESKCMEHCLIRDAVPVSAVKDDRLRLHGTSLLAAKELAKASTGISLTVALRSVRHPTARRGTLDHLSTGPSDHDRMLTLP